jgi:hypothetical protein
MTSLGLNLRNFISPILARFFPFPEPRISRGACALNIFKDPEFHLCYIRRNRGILWITPGLNFINVLRTAFTHIDPESVRIQSNPQYLFMPSGSTSVKAVRRTLVKLTPDGSTTPQLGLS